MHALAYLLQTQMFRLIAKVLPLLADLKTTMQIQHRHDAFSTNMFTLGNITQTRVLSPAAIHSNTV